MKRTLNYLSQCIAGCLAVVFFLKFLDNFDILYLAGITTCVAFIVGVRKVPNSGNLSVIDTMNEKEKNIYSLSKVATSFVLACGIATPFLFGMRIPRSENEMYIFIVLIPIGLLFGAMLVTFFQLRHLFSSEVKEFLAHIKKFLEKITE